MKKINIYITQKTYNKINEIKQKYKVSLSTIIDKGIESIKANNIVKLKMKYYYPNEKKTSVKPRMTNTLNGFKDSEISMIYSNFIELYINDSWKDIGLTAEEVKRIKNEINTKLQKAREQFWNYNEVIRNTARAMKENKEYYERIMHKS